MPVGPFFTAVGELLKGLATPFMDFMEAVFDWARLGLLVKHWSPITAFFKGLWEGVKPYLQPILSMFGLEEGGAGLTAKVAGYAEEQRQRNAGVGGGTGAFLQANAVSIAKGQQSERSLTQPGLAPGQLLRPPGLPAPGALLQSSLANNRTQLEGGLVMRFENAPAGFRADPGTTNQPGLSITPKVGYRSLSGSKQE